MQLPTVPEGRALIITGDQGCGKTTAAKQYAKQFDGRYAFGLTSDLVHKSSNDWVHYLDTDLLVLDEFDPTNHEHRAMVKWLAESTIFRCPTTFSKWVTLLKAPKIILLTTNPNPLDNELAKNGYELDASRFVVFPM